MTVSMHPGQVVPDMVRMFASTEHRLEGEELVEYAKRRMSLGVSSSPSVHLLRLADKLELNVFN